MITRAALVAAAIAWEGTPYVAQAYPRRGLCCDCATFLPGVGMDAGIFPPDMPIPAYSANRHLHRSDEAYRDALRALEFTEIEPPAAQPGDVLLEVVGERQPASHSGIVIERDAARPIGLIHAVNRGGLARVCRMRINAAHWARVRYAFAFPGVSDG